MPTIRQRSKISPMLGQTSGVSRDVRVYKLIASCDRMTKTFDLIEQRRNFYLFSWHLEPNHAFMVHSCLSLCSCDVSEETCCRDVDNLKAQSKIKTRKEIRQCSTHGCKPGRRHLPGRLLHLDPAEPARAVTWHRKSKPWI